MEGFKSSLTSQQIEEKLLQSNIGVIELPESLTFLNPQSSSEDIYAVVSNIYQQYKNIDGPFIAVLRFDSVEPSAQSTLAGLLIVGDENTIIMQYEICAFPYSQKMGGIIMCQNGECQFMAGSYYCVNMDRALSVGSGLFISVGETIQFLYSDFTYIPQFCIIFDRDSNQPIGNILFYTNMTSGVARYVSPMNQIVYLNQKQYNLKCSFDDEQEKVFISLEEIS